MTESPARRIALLTRKYQELEAMRREAEAKLLKIVLHPDATGEMIAELRKDMVPMDTQVRELRQKIETRLGLPRRMTQPIT